MLHWLATAALAGPPPEGVDLFDLDAWEAGARALRDGPSRCWVFEGTVNTRLSVFTRPTLWTRSERHDVKYTGSFTGRFEGGRWVTFDHDAQRVDDTTLRFDLDLDLPVRPMMGAMDQDVVRYVGPPRDDDPTDEDADDAGAKVSVSAEAAESSEQSLSLIDEALDALSPATTTSFAQWSDAPRGVRLTQDAPMDDRPRSPVVTLQTFFPDGAPIATEVDVTFPPRYRTGEGPVKVILMEPQLRLRAKKVGAEALPVAEGVSMVIGVLGFTVGVEQSLAYTRATACAP